jgi:hypothetical protein
MLTGAKLRVAVFVYESAMLAGELITSGIEAERF